MTPVRSATLRRGNRGAVVGDLQDDLAELPRVLHPLLGRPGLGQGIDSGDGRA